METLKLNARLQTRDPEVLLDATLPVGRYVVSLVVTTDQGESEAARLSLTVQRPIVRPPIPGPILEPVRPTPVPPIVRPTPITPVVGPTPVIRDAPEARPRKPRAKKSRPKKEE